MRIFVTGCESFIGHELLNQCDQRGIEVVGIDLLPSQRPGCVLADVRSPDVADTIPDRVDAVVHLGAVSRDSDCANRAYEAFDVNVMGTLNLINAAEKRGATQFVFASSEWVYGDCGDGQEKNEDSVIDPSLMTSEYAFSKLVSEINLQQKHKRGFCHVTILRFGIVYGPRKDNWAAVESLFNSVATVNEITVGSLRTARRFIHVSDIADGILASLGLEGCHIINLEGERLVSLGDVIETSKIVIGRDPSVFEKAPEKASIRNISNSKAQALLKWTAKIELENGLKTLLGSF